MVTLAALLLALPSQSLLVEVRYDVFLGGRAVGDAVAREYTMPGGGSKETFEMDATFEQIQLKGEGEMISAKSGRILSSFETRSINGHKETLLKQYGSVSVRFIHTKGKAVTRKELQIPKGAVLINPGQDWFEKVMPKVGARADYWRVNSKGIGAVEKHTYKGAESLVIQGTRQTVYLIKTDEGRMWVNRKNIPVKMEMPLGNGLDLLVVAKSFKGPGGK